MLKHNVHLHRFFGWHGTDPAADQGIMDGTILMLFPFLFPFSPPFSPSDRGRRIEYAEVFEISEYGSPLDWPARQRLFPFQPEAPKT